MWERDRSSDSGLPPPPPSRPWPVASWRRSVSPHSGGTVPDSHRVPSPRSCARGRAYHRTVSGPARPTLAPRRRLGGRHLRAVLGARPRDRARRLGSGAAQARAREPSTRYSERCSPARSGQRRDRARRRDRVRRERRGAPGVRRRAAWGRRSTSRSTRSASSCGVAHLATRACAALRVSDHGRSRSTSTARSPTRVRSGATGWPRRARSWASTRRRCPFDRGEAAAELDRRGAGNWRALLERFSEERAPVYLRRDAASGGRAPDALRARARDRGLHRCSGAARARRPGPAREPSGACRLSRPETDALERLLAGLGADTSSIRTTRRAHRQPRVESSTWRSRTTSATASSTRSSSASTGSPRSSSA